MGTDFLLLILSAMGEKNTSSKVIKMLTGSRVAKALFGINIFGDGGNERRARKNGG